MKTLRLLAAVGVSLLALTAPASADPITIGSWILLNLLPGLIGSGIGAAAVGYTALAVAAIGLNVGVALATRQKIKPQDYKNTFSTGESSEIRGVGRGRVGGLKCFGNTNEFDRYRLIAHTKGPITAVEEHYLGGREVTVEADGYISSPPWARPPADETRSYVRVQSKVGDGTETAWSDLITAFPVLWTAEHRVRGIAQSLVQYISPGIESPKFMKLYQNFPDYERLQRSEPVYDPRDETQSVDNPATYKWSENGVLNAAHILRSYPSFSSSDFDWEGIGEQATLADATTAKYGGGTEARSRCWGFWPSENPRNSVMEQVLESTGLEIVPGADAKILLRLINDIPTPEIEFSERHIIEINRRYGPESVERPNLCVVKYYSPERNFDMGEIDLTGIAWARVQDEIDRYGEKIFTVELPFCPSAAQAQRIARRMFALARADAGMIKLNMAGLAAWGFSYASIPFADLDVTETCAIGSPRVNDEEGIVEIPFVVWPDLTEWDPDVDEAPPPPQVPDIAASSSLEQPGIPTGYAQVQYPGGGYELRVAYTLPSGGTITEAVYRVKDDDGIYSPSNSMTEIDTPIAFAYADTNQIGEDIDFRVRIFNDDGDGSSFSPALEITNVQIDNTAPGAPGVTVENYVGPGPEFATLLRLTITATALNVVRAVVEFTDNAGSSWSHFATHDNVRPGTNIYNTDEQAAAGKGFRVLLYTSDLTPGTATGQAIV